MSDRQDEVQGPSVLLGQVVDLLEGLYPLDYAEDWDHPGLVAGIRPGRSDGSGALWTLGLMWFRRLWITRPTC